MTTPSSINPCTAHVAFAPALALTRLHEEVASAEIERDLRVARALRKRRAEIYNEMKSCLRQRANTYKLADAFLDEFDELAKSDKRLGKALRQVEQRLQRVD